MIRIDGSFGEGGGQILRSSICLSLITGKAFDIINIRANRENPGLQRQHLTAVNAAAEISDAEIVGNYLGSDKLIFRPNKVKAGEYLFAVSSAGSTTLILQTILPALLFAKKESTITLDGGTHNPFAPPYDFLEKSFIPVINKMGAKIAVEIAQYGFYPIGGGIFQAKIKPIKKLNEIEILERGNLKQTKAFCLYSDIPEKIAQEELNILKNDLEIEEENCLKKNVPSPGSGNVVLVEMEYDNIDFIATAFGKKNLPRQRVVQNVIKQVNEYLNTNAAIGEYLADQLLIPMALAGGGKIRTLKPSCHTDTNITVIKKFLDINIKKIKIDDTTWDIQVQKNK